MSETDGAQEVKVGKVTKYWWFLLIIPIGLIVGTVTSTYNHLKHDREKDEMLEYRVSEQISQRSLEDDMRKAFESPTQSAQTTLKAISSSNGINHYLKLRPVGDGSGALGYYDVQAGDSGVKKEVLAVVFTLDERDAVSRASMIGIGNAVMKSVFGERDFKHTLRFIFLPSAKTDLLENSNILTLPGEKLIDFVVIKPIDEGNFTKVEWIQQGNTISHMAISRRSEKILTEKQIKLALHAAKQLRAFLLDQL